MASQMNAGTSDGKEGADGGAHKKIIVHFSSREPDQIPGPIVSGDADVSAQRQRQQLDKLTDSLSASLQQQRLTHPDFQPFSLPPSRVSCCSFPPPRLVFSYCIIRSRIVPVTHGVCARSGGWSGATHIYSPTIRRAPSPTLLMVMMTSG